MARAPGLKNREGEPVTRLPLSEPYEPRRFDWNDRRTSFMSTVLLGRNLRRRYNGHVGAAFSFRCELNLSINEREQRVIFAGTDIMAGVPFGTALARKDIAGEHDLAAGRLQAEPLARRVAAVSRRSACFFVRHSGLSNSLTVYTDSVKESSHFFLLFVAGFFAAAFAGFLVFAGPASAAAASALGFGSRLGLGAAVFDGLAPPVRISVMRTTENSCR